MFEIEQVEQAPTVDLKEFKETVEKMYQAKKDLEQAENKFKELKAKVTEIMESHELDKFQADSCTVSLNLKSSVSVPKDIEQKRKLFDYIKNNYGEQVLESMLTINSRTFSSWFTKEQEAKLQEGELDFTIADIKPHEYYSLGIRKR